MATLINGVMDILHDQSLPTIGLLQESFPNNTNFMINISTLFDPRYVFLIYAPILFAFNKRVGHRMIIALTLAEWANQILKWLLAGERPYWYVHERANELHLAQQVAALNSANITTDAGSGAGGLLIDNDHNAAGSAPLIAPVALTSLKQFPVTCELGAGSPSGHSMVTATVWYILIDAYLKNELQLFGRADYTQIALKSHKSSVESQKLLLLQSQQGGGAGSSSQLLAKLFWSVYTLMLLLVGLSRVYLACHFPHQCLFGALLGCLLARCVADLLPMESLRRRHFCYATAAMFATVMATYGVLRLTGFDPLWSVGKAMRWCAKSEYIHLDTTPFFSMMRYLGFCLGTGLAYNARKMSLSRSAPTTSTTTTSGRTIGLTIRRIIVVGLAVAFGQFLMALPMPKTNLNLFYVISFVMYTTFSFAIAGPIPDTIKSILPASTIGKQQQRQQEEDSIHSATTTTATRTHLKQR